METSKAILRELLLGRVWIQKRPAQNGESFYEQVECVSLPRWFFLFVIRGRGFRYLWHQASPIVGRAFWSVACFVNTPVLQIRHVRHDRERVKRVFVDGVEKDRPYAFMSLFGYGFVRACRLEGNLVLQDEFRSRVLKSTRWGRITYTTA